MKKLITITLSRKTHDLLLSAGHENEGIDSIIKRLLKEWKVKL